MNCVNSPNPHTLQQDMRTPHWHYLQPGDQVDIIAPGYGCPPSLLNDAALFLEKIGLKAHIPEGLLGEDPFCSNHDSARLQHVQAALTNPDSKAIWCIRGGYGCARLTPELVGMNTPEHVKLLIGFSDITVLHLLFQQRFGWPTLHGPILTKLCGKAPEDEAVQAMLALLTGKQATVSFTTLTPLNQAAQQERTITSSVTGGNLSLLQASIGTPWQLEGEGRIVLIEEVGERGYRIDRMLVHLEQAGLFRGVQAIMIGDITGDEEKDGTRLGALAIQRFADNLSIPVVQCQGIGHGDLNHPLPFGTTATLHLGHSPSLHCETGGA